MSPMCILYYGWKAAGIMKEEWSSEEKRVLPRIRFKNFMKDVVGCRLNLER